MGDLSPYMDGLDLPEEWRIAEMKEFAKVKGGKRMPKGRPFAPRRPREDQTLYDLEGGPLHLHRRNARRRRDHPGRELAQRQIGVLKGVGSGVPKLALFRIETIQTPLPPLPEQRKIAAILSSVDEAIEATQAVIDQVQVVKKGLMQELLTKGLPGRHKKFKQTEIGQIPEVWEVVELASLARRNKGAFVNGPFGSNLLKSDLKPSGVPVIYIRDIKEGRYRRVSTSFVSESKADELRVCRVDAGDVLVTKVGDPPGVAAVYPKDKPHALVTQDVVRLKIDVSLAEPEFVRILLNSPVMAGILSDIVIVGTRKRFALGQYKKLRVPLPPLTEQRGILTAFGAVEENQECLFAKVNALRTVKQALMSVLLTGELRVQPEATT